MATDPLQSSSTPEPTGWQAQKSAATRNLIVEAAIRCFVDLGYAQTTTTAIAEKAGLSRGAMLHHFPSKIDIPERHAIRRAGRRAVGRAAAVRNRSHDQEREV